MTATSLALYPASSLLDARHSNLVFRRDLDTFDISSWFTVVNASLVLSTTPSIRVPFCHHVTLGTGRPTNRCTCPSLREFTLLPSQSNSLTSHYRGPSLPAPLIHALTITGILFLHLKCR